MSGWIKIQREIKDHWCSSDPNFFAVWFRLLAEANFKTNKIMFNGSPVTVKRGSLIFGLNAFSKRSGVSVSKLRRFIRILLDEGMIDRQIFNKYSIISITNYSKHQSVDKQKAGKQQADDKQTTILEEGKEGKERKEVLFEKFWTAFDHKAGKSGALKSWMEIKDFDDNLFNEIIDGAKKYARYRNAFLKPNDRTPKMAQGWLSGKRWEDEIDESQLRPKEVNTAW